MPPVQFSCLRACHKYDNLSHSLKSDIKTEMLQNMFYEPVKTPIASNPPFSFPLLFPPESAIFIFTLQSRFDVFETIKTHRHPEFLSASTIEYGAGQWRGGRGAKGAIEIRTKGAWRNMGAIGDKGAPKLFACNIWLGT